MALSPFSRPLLIVLVWAATIGLAQAVVTDQFLNWYDQFGSVFERIKKEKCSVEYKRYLTGDRQNHEPDVNSGGDEFSVLTQPLIDCLLKNTSEFIKGNMTGSQVLLGVMPTVLSLLSASVDELAMVMTVSRRPILALLLAFGSPSAYFSRAFSYPTAHEILNRHKDRQPMWHPRGVWQKALVSAAEYIAIFALAANVLHCGWEVGIRAVSIILSDSAFLPPFWVGSGVFVQLLGVFVFRLRVQGWRIKRRVSPAGTSPGTSAGPATTVIETNEKAPATRVQTQQSRQSVSQHRSFRKWLRGTGPRLLGFASTEFIPSVANDFEIRLVTFPERNAFLVAAWFQSTIAVLHVVFGTLVFSSMMFIGTHNALAIVSRFFVSTLVCRIVIRYELAGLREACGDILKGTGDEEEGDIEAGSGVSAGAADDAYQAHLAAGLKSRVTKTATAETGEASSYTPTPIHSYS